MQAWHSSDAQHRLFHAWVAFPCRTACAVVANSQIPTSCPSQCQRPFPAVFSWVTLLVSSDPLPVELLGADSAALGRLESGQKHRQHAIIGALWSAAQSKGVTQQGS